MKREVHPETSGEDAATLGLTRTQL